MTNTSHLDFGPLFSEADSKFNRSVELNELSVSYSNVLFTSAIAKCLDFNKLAQKTDSVMPSFFLVPNVRTMCEELIYCSLFRHFGQQRSDELAMGLNHLAFLKNIHAQTRFFALNNQMQPSLGGFIDSAKQKVGIKQATKAGNKVWKRLIDTNNRYPPSIQQLSHKVGLETTYDYVYHLTSNFVHFNPPQLFRTGWESDEGTFSFCVENFNEYFSYLARFLGALVFLGYCYLDSNKFEPNLANQYADTIANQLTSNFRWPEITTYEEMNEAVPNNIFYRPLMTVMRGDDTNAMPDILAELKGLANLGSMS